MVLSPPLHALLLIEVILTSIPFVIGALWQIDLAIAALREWLRAGPSAASLRRPT